MAFPGTPVGHLFNRGMNPQPLPPGLRQEELTEFPPRNSVSPKKLTELGV